MIIPQNPGPDEPAQPGRATTTRPHLEVAKSSGPLAIWPQLADHPYRVGVSSDGTVIGDDPLADGMNVSVRFRRDFVVTDAARLLATARGVFLELNPTATPDDADAAVASTADAIFTILERDGLIGDAVDARLAAREADGLGLAGWQAQLIPNEPEPLRPGQSCLRGDVFALPQTE